MVRFGQSLDNLRIAIVPLGRGGPVAVCAHCFRPLASTDSVTMVRVGTPGPLPLVVPTRCEPMRGIKMPR
jgi:hypothetical protein